MGPLVISNRQREESTSAPCVCHHAYGIVSFGRGHLDTLATIATCRGTHRKQEHDPRQALRCSPMLPFSFVYFESNKDVELTLHFGAAHS